MIVVHTHGADETAALGAAVAALARGGDLLLLAGDLGAGKTVFVKGFAHKLGVEADVTSPTFTLAHHYEGRVPVNHLDVYRIEQIQEVADLALPELLDSDAVTLVEWGDAIVAAVPAEFLEIRFMYDDGDDDRLIELRTVGNGWSARSRALTTALQPWSAEPC